MMHPGSSNSNRRVLVVGTTPDYVQWIRAAQPGRVLFLTEDRLRRETREPRPEPDEEITASLDEAGVDALEEAVRAHLNGFGLALGGIACFDCERMALASELAGRFGLRYPSTAAILRCRDKSQSKSAWREHGVGCPRFGVPASAEELKSLTTRWNSPFVIKPLTGSGSELVFRCDSHEEGEAAFLRTAAFLAAKRESPMYRESVNGRPGILVEEWVSGPEYSCDFLLRDGQVTLVRLCGKHLREGSPFGVTEAYELIGVDESPFEASRLRRELGRAAASLGIDDAWCMADFLERDALPVFLEITPRPGGDCLPWLLRAASGRDVLMELLDFAERRPVPRAAVEAKAVGLRLFAAGEGTLRHIETGRLLEDPRVRDVTLRRRPGDRIALPPKDYDAWILGHAVYVPEPGRSIACQNGELAERIDVRWE